MNQERDLVLVVKITAALGKPNYFEECQCRPPGMEVPYENRSPKYVSVLRYFKRPIFCSMTAKVCLMFLKITVIYKSKQERKSSVNVASIFKNRIYEQLIF